jgi:hypothetical protein
MVLIIDQKQGKCLYVIVTLQMTDGLLIVPKVGEMVLIIKNRQNVYVIVT